MTCVDTVWKCDQPVQPGGKSNFAAVHKSVGGVGANLARAVVRSQNSPPVNFITAVGSDSEGSEAIKELKTEMNVLPKIPENQVTGQYMCVVEPTGELNVAAQDMELAKIHLEPSSEVVRSAALILTDLNFSKVRS